MLTSHYPPRLEPKAEPGKPPTIPSHHPEKSQIIARAPLAPNQKPHSTIPHLTSRKIGKTFPNDNNYNYNDIIIEPNSMHSLRYISPPSPQISEISAKGEQGPNQIPKNYSHHKQRANSYCT